MTEDVVADRVPSRGGSPPARLENHAGDLVDLVVR
jgi:hypothetical protein